MTQYLVTGGAGFIGSHLCRRLLADGHAVRVIDDLSSGQRDNLADIIDEVELVVGDLRDEALLDKVLRGVDYALHHAAVASVQTSVERPLFEQEVNAVGTLRFFEAARRAGVGRVVFAASAAAYGNNPTVPKREQMIPEPESPYAISKVMGEYYARVYSQLYGLQVVCLRYFNVFGPRQDPSSPYSGVISIFAERMLKGEAPVIFGDGGQSRDFVYVDNIVEANMRACTTPEAAGRVYNIGCERSVSILELVTALNEILGTALDPVFNPARQGDVRVSLADIAQARTQLGYEPIVHFAEGLQQTVAWMKSR
ncbi:MAG: SDR family oxidoreductase [Candidatus Latescibacteria bacterium]|nr:SDR family oxidoreductase [Candidatus Latescibacterota bacterium]